jgi:2-phosphosulfolactate phosphatase
MEFREVTLETCHTATGLVVVIDVLRAFTTAAYIFEAGAQTISLVSTVEEALAQRQQEPGGLIIGEVHGLSVAEFDFNNSPAALQGRDFRTRSIIQRTSAGVQGVVGSTRAETLLAGSFVCAAATVDYIRRLAPAVVTFVITGIIYENDGEEDQACADYLKACLWDEQPEAAPYIERVYQSTAGRKFADPFRPEFPAADLQLCTEVDRFNFAMQARRQEAGLFLNKVMVKPKALL